MDEPHSISPQDLYGRIGTASSPVVLDVRPDAAFNADERMLVSAIRRPPKKVGKWRHDLPTGRSVVVYCAHGHEVSEQLAAALRGSGLDAGYLEGGITEWSERGLPLRKRISIASNCWVTRERPKIDRIACPWLIRRFIDPEATFLYVPTERVFDVAAASGATAYDIPGAEPFSHDGELCSFDAFLKVYGIEDPALDALALIVRGADTARLELTAQSPGLLAVSLGLSSIYAGDHAMLERGMTVYDALYAWCRDCRDQGHDWNPSAMAVPKPL
jgi:rhodanese-related sulfurtransferase